jgi:hypothetical protein
MLLTARSFARLAVASCVVAVAVIPGFAQTHSGNGGVALERTSAGALREYTPAVWLASDSLDIPANLIVPSSFRSVIERMLRHSPVFRRQCQRIANASTLTVRLKRLGRPPGYQTRARTTINREQSGALVAEIEIPPLDDDVELIAHEIEHVVEQLDNVDLPSRAARAGTGVQTLTVAPLVFETTRAARTGRRAAEEVRRSAR